MTMNSLRLIQCSMGMAALSSGISLAAAPPVYPVPQQPKWTSQTVTSAGKPSVVLRSAKTAGNRMLDGVPEKSGAYKLVVSPQGRVSIGAHDERGAFYAMQTLRQLGKKTGSGDVVQLPVGEVTDWPDVEFRGTVEGFYGTPWSHEARLSQLRFYGQNKMNTYIYGPKDDPYHSSPHWRDPYPATQAAQIRELVKTARENHVDFVWAIHPGKDIKWTEEDMNNVIKKFEMMYKLGVRSFSVFFDDIFGEGTKADKQALLLNKINNEFVKVKKDVTPLVMCPTEYNRGWSDPKPGTYLDILGEQLDPSVHVMWTGDSVCHDITLEGQQWVNRRIKRPSYVWWNFPVTDYCRSNLCMGRVYGLAQEPGAAQELGGFVSNPMDKPEASKVPLFGVADYSWNIKGFDSDTSWKEGVKRLFPQAAEAMQIFVNHNSDQGPNGHGYRREESVEIAPVVQRVLEAVKKGGKPSRADADLLRKEFARMAAAAPVIRERANNPRLMQEIGAWVDAFEQLGRAGQYAMNALQDGNSKTAVVDLIRVTQALAAMERISRQHNQAGQLNQSVVKTGSRVMTPAVQELADAVSNKVFADVAGSPAILPKPMVKGGNMDGAAQFCDGDRNTFWHSGAYGEKGDWYGADYGTLIPVRSVEVLMGRNDSDGDYVAKGQLEATQDMQTWKPLGPQTSGPQVVWQNDRPVPVRAVRYRVVEPKMTDSGRAVWTAVREIAVNAPAPSRAASNVEGLENVSVQKTDKIVGLNRVMETRKIKPGEFISLTLERPTDATWLEVNLGRDDLNDWAEVTLDVEGSAKPPVQKLDRQGQNFIARGPQLPKGVKGMKLVNKSDREQDIVLNMFKFDVPPADPSANMAALTDRNLKTVYGADRPLDVIVPNLDNLKATRVLIVGSAACSVQARKGEGPWVQVGKRAAGAGVSEFAIPAGTSAVRLFYNAPQQDAVINEVIFPSQKAGSK